jgi:aquaporin Z
MATVIRKHWPEYLMEAAELGIFMVSACTVTAIVEYPASPVRQAIPDPFVRRVLVGIAMGLTAISIVYSPWGKQSGAHLNPSLTLVFFRLGKVDVKDASFYILSQFVGGFAGVLLAAVIIGTPVLHPLVKYAATVPGVQGPVAAFIAELLISFVQMSVILRVSNQERIARFTGLFAGALVATYISVEAPFSGMSMNPARTLASAIPAHLWTGLWIYFTAPTVGMLLAAEVYLRSKGIQNIHCAKLHHQNSKRCIFCEYQRKEQARRNQTAEAVWQNSETEEIGSKPTFSSSPLTSQRGQRP